MTPHNETFGNIETRVQVLPDFRNAIGEHGAETFAKHIPNGEVATLLSQYYTRTPEAAKHDSAIAGLPDLVASLSNRDTSPT